MSIANTIAQHEAPLPTNGAADTVNASNANAVLTLAAPGAGKSNVLCGIAWSYSGVPTGGRLKIEDVSGTIVFDVDITSGGPGFLPFTPPKKNAATNSAFIITLYAGGSGIVGKLNVLGAWVE